MKVTRFLFFATVFCVTFEKVHWNVAGTVSLADVLAIVFLVLWTIERLALHDRRLPRTSAVVLCFALVFLLVYLLGFFNIDTAAGVGQFGKGMFKCAIHFLFLARRGRLPGAPRRRVLLADARRGSRPGWSSTRSTASSSSSPRRAAGTSTARALAADRRRELDQHLRRRRRQSVYRPNALTGDPNHLGIMLIVPLLVLMPLYLRLGRGHPLRTQLAVVLGFLLLVELATLSRSGLLGLLVGLLILAIPYRQRLASRELLVPLAGRRSRSSGSSSSRGCTSSRRCSARASRPAAARPRRTSTSTTSSRRCSRSHPLFGLGLNNFSVYYELVTGKTNWGPHSFYVALLVETGLVGTAVFVAFLWYLFRRLRAARAIGGRSRRRAIRPRRACGRSPGG